MLAATGLGIVSGIGFGLYIGTNHLTRPINKVTDTIKQVAGGDFNVDVPYVGRGDEIGDMAAAVEVFKQSGLAVQRMHSDEAVLRAKSDDLQSGMSHVVASAAAGDFSRRIEKTYNDENLDRFARNVNELVASVDAGITETRRVIAELAAGDLTQTMRGTYQGAFAELQQNVNATLLTLQDTMREVRDTTEFDPWKCQRAARCRRRSCQAHRAAGCSPRGNFGCARRDHCRGAELDHPRPGG